MEFMELRMMIKNKKIMILIIICIEEPLKEIFSKEELVF